MKRLITGILAFTVWLLLLLLGPFLLFAATITILTGVLLNEYLAIVMPSLSKRNRLPIILFGLLPLVGSYFGTATGVLCGLTFALIALLLHTLFRYASFSQPYEVVSRGGFGYLYLSLCTAHLVLLMALPMGRIWLLLLTAIIVASDTAAFYTGSKFGKRKLYPAISPGKTWEGFAGGLAGSLAAALLVWHFFLPEQGLFWICFIVVLLNCLGVAGDFAESLIKRAFGVKDSGSLLPGHGGVLDRTDSLLLTAPALYYLLYLGAGLCLW